jgi:chitin disaccharide deacetylase
MNERLLIVNADDFGRSHGVNRGIAAAHDHGIVTSASLMVRWPAAETAAALALSRPRLSVGLHVDLSEWLWRDGEWTRVYSVVGEDGCAVAKESRRQLAVFRSLLGRDPSHLDSHQHVHRAEPVRSVLAALAAELGVPLRQFTPGIDYRGDYYGQTTQGAPIPAALTIDSLSAVVRSLIPGTTELACHPAAEVDFETGYRAERLIEFEVLRSAEIRRVLEAENIRLVSFDQLLRGA